MDLSVGAALLLFAPCVPGLTVGARPIYGSIPCLRGRVSAVVCQQPVLPLAAGDEEEPQWQRTLGQPSKSDPYRVVKRVAPLLLFHVLWSAALTALNEGCGMQLRIPALLHTLLGGVLGLLLAFRTNQAYTRYWSSCQSLAELQQTVQNLARLAGHVIDSDPKLYLAIMRHLKAFPVALKQHLRRAFSPEEFMRTLSASEIDFLCSIDPGWQGPHSAVLSTLSTLLRPIKARDDGSGQELALWGEMERSVGQLQSIASSLDLVVLQPPPASYSLHTARFVLLWVSTLPLALAGAAMPPLAIPVALLGVAWALYSTEELAQLMEEPFGDARGGKPEMIPLDRFASRIVAALNGEMVAQRALERRVAGGSWVVRPADLQRPGSTDVDFDVDVDDYPSGV